jgi:hypothetical protein
MLQLGLGAGRAGMALFAKAGEQPFDRLLPESLTRFFFNSDGGYSGFAWPLRVEGHLGVHGDTFWNLGSVEMVAGIILLFWIFLVFGMLAGYAVSYCFSSQTLIYFLLRKKVDGIEMNEVYEEKEDGEDEAVQPDTAVGDGIPPAAPPAGAGPADTTPPTTPESGSAPPPTTSP